MVMGGIVRAVLVTAAVLESPWAMHPVEAQQWPKDSAARRVFPVV